VATVRFDSPSDPRLADYRLTDPSLLRDRNLFIAEGRLVVERLLADGRYIVRSVLVSDAAHAALADRLAALAPDVPVYLGRVEQFQAITGFNIHRGCLAIIERPAPARLEQVTAGRSTIVVLEGVTNADNVGGVFRNAAAFGAGAVVLSPTCCDPLYRKAVRTSMGATLRVPFARLDDWPSGLTNLRHDGFTIAALTPHGSMTLEAFATFPPPRKLALLIGTEGDGLSSAALAYAEHRVRIAMRAEIDSLNLAVASGIALSRLSGGRDLG
jgi:tRNA G18 (ribose-2'-O)-methylase SpoU